MFPPDVHADDYCYLTTTGRVSGEPRTIEIWFAISGASLYMLAGAGERSHWVRNLRRAPAVTIRIREQTLAARGRGVGDPAEDALARHLLFEKYTPRYSGDLTGWSRTALPVAFDFPAGPETPR